MDRETTILIIAQNGLKTAATLFASKATKLEKQFDKATDDAEKKKAKKSMDKAKKLAAVLTAADQGITSYLAESSEA